MPKQSKKDRKEKSLLKEWLNAVVFAVVVATTVRWLVVEPYKIPTSSMEKSLLVGDFLFVSKFHYGSRNAKTLLQIPLTHQKLWGTEIPSYLEWIQIPFFRLPGFSQVQKGDAVVFNSPEELDLPIDMRTYLIKRCVGVAGDTISIKNGLVHINSRAQESLGKQQHSYFIRVNQTLRDRFFSQYKIIDINQKNGGYVVMTSQEKAQQIKSLDFIQDVIPLTDKNAYNRFSYNVYANNGVSKWTFNNLGPLYIPEKGRTIPINQETIRLYGYLIKNHEGIEQVEILDSGIKIDGEQITEYTFGQDYFFMMGDNRHNSNDSRAWGFVPMNHIVGKALFTWFSLEEGSFIKIFNRIRWNRIFKEIE